MKKHEVKTEVMNFRTNISSVYSIEDFVVIFERVEPLIFKMALNRLMKEHEVLKINFNHGNYLNRKEENFLDDIWVLRYEGGNYTVELDNNKMVMRFNRNGLYEIARILMNIYY